MTIETEKDLTSGGDTLRSGGDLTLTSKGHQTLTSQSLTQHAEVHQKGVDYDQTSRRHKKTTLTSGGKITLKSGGNTVLQGVDATFKEGLSVQANGTLESAPVYDGDSFSLDVKSKGTFGSYESHEQSQTLQVNPNTFAGQGDIAFTSQGKLTIQANKLATDKEVTLSSTQDTVHMKAAQSVSAHQKSENSSNMITQTQSGHGYVDERTHLSQIEAAKVTIRGKKGTTVEVGPQGVGAGPDLVWAQALMKEKGITWHQIQEEHKAWSYSQTSLTPGAAAVLGGAINLATAGTLTPLAGTIVSNLAVNLVNNGGRLDRAFKATFTGDGLKSIVKSYVMNELFQGADANSDFSERLAQNAMRASASAGIDMALYGTDFKDALRSAAVNTVADTVAQEVSRQIGAEYGKDDSALNYATHKLDHGAVGAGVGALRGSLAKDAEGGAISGAMGAVIGEVIAESQQKKIQGRVLERVKELESQGNTITPELIHDITRQEASGMMNAASFSSAVAAFAAGKDPNLASSASNDAIDNNFDFAVSNFALQRVQAAEEKKLASLEAQAQNNDLSSEAKKELGDKIQAQAQKVKNLGVYISAERAAQYEAALLSLDIADKVSDAAGLVTGGTTTAAKKAIKEGAKAVVKEAKKQLTKAAGKKAANQGGKAEVKKITQELPKLPKGYHYKTIKGKTVPVRNPGALNKPKLRLEGNKLVEVKTVRKAPIKDKETMKVVRNKKGRVTGVTNTEKHHIISDKNEHTKNHELWKKSGVSPDDRMNKMILPKPKAKTTTEPSLINVYYDFGQAEIFISKPI